MVLSTAHPVRDGVGMVGGEVPVTARVAVLAPPGVEESEAQRGACARAALAGLLLVFDLQLLQLMDLSGVSWKMRKAVGVRYGERSGRNGGRGGAGMLLRPE